MSSSVFRRTPSRMLTSSLALTCVALATVLVLLTSLVVRHADGSSVAQPPVPVVSVFSDASAPRSIEPVSTDGTASFRLAASVTTDDGESGVFPEGTQPATPVDPDAAAVELGMRFTPKTDSTVSAIRFYQTPDNTGPHTGTLWGPTGEVLARVNFPDTDGTAGWREAAITPAVAVSAGTTYTASYFAPAGRYAADEGFFARGMETDTLSVPADAGVYAYGGGRFPTETYRHSNYYVDVVVAPITTAPQPQPTTEPEPTTAPSPDPSSSPEPTASPEPTTGPSTPPPAQSGAFGDTVLPGTPVDPDRASVELGMRFVPKVDGQVTAIRFYRSALNAGPHLGTLWDATGRALARVEFGDDRSQGWQTAALADPVAVTAGQTYTVSYLATVGRYSADEHYFDTGIETDYLSVPVGAGVYAYGSGAYPTENYNNSNYYVDVRFAAGATEPRPEPTTTPTPTPSTSPTPDPTPTSSPTPTVTPTPTPTVTPTPTPTASGPAPVPPGGGASSLNLPTEAWWGGSAYYAQFPKAKAAGWADPSFFPISVFFGKPSHAKQLAAIGINTYMGAEHDGSPMSTITGAGVSVLAQSEWTPAEVGNDPRVVGWHVSDECEMGYSNCSPNGDEYARLADQQRFASALRALNDGRFLQANFGNGVLGTWWAPNTMDDQVGLMDVTSVDKYAYTSPHVQDLMRDTPSWTGGNPATAGAYGWLQDRMEQFSSPAASKPNWIFVETAMPFLTEPGAVTITGNQIEGAVWNGLIHGAAGIAYFQHNNNGQCGTYSLIDCGQQLRDKVSQIDADVRTLAPVLNSPSYRWTFGDGLDTSLKAYNGSAYILAMATGTPGDRVFRLPPGVSGTSVEVVGENRTIAVGADGTFRDTFAAEYSHHIYRVALGR